MKIRHQVTFVCTAAAAACGLVIAPAPSASAAPCPDVEVVFARGTGEPAGVGEVGQAFVDSLRAKAGSRSIEQYGVDYAATLDFPRAVDGINDASAHVQATAANCPTTKFVLGGYSQGAAVAGFVTSAVVPPGAVAYDGTGPMPPAIADHVAAVALFGKPKDGFMGMIGQPPVVIGPLYADKTLDSCVPGDPICSDGGDFSLHHQYIADGMVDTAADFAVSKLAPTRKQRSAPPSAPVAQAPVDAAAPGEPAPADPALLGG